MISNLSPWFGSQARADSLREELHRVEEELAKGYKQVRALEETEKFIEARLSSYQNQLKAFHGQKASEKAVEKTDLVVRKLGDALAKLTKAHMNNAAEIQRAKRHYQALEKEKIELLHLWLRLNK